MDAKLKEKWVAALRSREYTQATGGLRNQYDNFCCLGVLCEIDSETTWDGEEQGYIYSADPDSVYVEDLINSLGRNEDAEATGESLMHHFGLNTEVHTNLIKLNDEDKAPFSQIADFIEKEL